MMKITTWVAVATSTALLGLGCATTAAEQQRRAETHQSNSDSAARNGQYGLAGEEQRKAQEAQNKAVMQSIDEGRPVARVPQATGDVGQQQRQP